MKITDLSAAITTQYNSTAGDGLRAVNTGGFWFMEASDLITAKENPYGVFTWDGSDVDEQAGGTQLSKQRSRIETASMTFSFFSKNDDGGTEIFDIIEKAMELFDWANLVFPEGSTLTPLILRRNSLVNRGKIDKIWTIDMNYDLMFEH